MGRAWLALLVFAVGCRSVATPRENPTVVFAGEANRKLTDRDGSQFTLYDLVWTTTIEVVEKYFDVAYESRYDGRIETRPQSGATLLELWLPDSVDAYERLESTLQTVRRRAYVRVRPEATGGFAISIEVYKELEDLQQPAFARIGGGVQITSIEPVGEQLVNSAIKPSRGWISLGQDTKLESKILSEIRSALEPYIHQ